MKKLLTIILVIFAFIVNAQDITPLPSITIKKLISPNNPVFYYNTADSALWIFKGETGWLRIATNAQLQKYYVPYDNANKDVHLGDKTIKSVSFILDTTYTHTGNEEKGTLAWNEATQSVETHITDDLHLNNGEELWVPLCYNNTPDTIRNGRPVYVDGAYSSDPTIQLASNLTYPESRLIGVATQNIPPYTRGRVTRFGFANDVDLSGCTPGSNVYLGDKVLTHVRPMGGLFPVVIGKAIVCSSTGRLLVYPQTAEYTSEINNAYGWASYLQGEQTIISFVDGTRVFSIAPVSSTFYFYQAGLKYIKTGTQSITITDVEGLHIIYYDLGILSEMVNPSNSQIIDAIRNKVITSVIYWDATNKVSIYVSNERHTFHWPSWVHAYAHLAFGTQYNSGLSLTGITLGIGSVNADAQFGSDSGTISDEDIVTTTDAVLSTAGIPIYYRLGSGLGNWRRVTRAGYAFLNDGTTGLAMYNLYSGGTWSITTMTNNYYRLVHVFATNDIGTPNKIIAMSGVAQYSSATLAEAAVNNEIANIYNSNLPFAEVKHIGSLILHTKTGLGNTVNARYVAIPSKPAGENFYMDFRRSTIIGAGGGGGSGATSFLGLSDTPDSYAGQANKIFGVASGETGTEFKAVTATAAGTVNIPTGQQYQINGGSVIVDAINDGVTTTAPSQNIVFDGLASKEPTLIKGNLTESITGLQFDNTRQVIGGAADLSLTSGYGIPTTTQLGNIHVLDTDKQTISGSGSTLSGYQISLDRTGGTVTLPNEADGSVTNEGQLSTVGTTNNATIQSNTSGSNTLNIKGGGINQVSVSGNDITITGTEVNPTTLPTPYSATFNNSGTGDTTGSTFNGSAAKTISYNTIGAEPAFSKNTAFNKNFGTTAGTVLEGRTFDNFVYGSNQRATSLATVDNAIIKSGFYFSGDVSGGIGTKNLVHSNWEGGDNVWMQIANPYADANNIYWRNNDFGTISPWKKFWTEGNFNPTNYAPASGSGNYIQNQNSTGQDANFWINNVAKFARGASTSEYLTIQTVDGQTNFYHNEDTDDAAAGYGEFNFTNNAAANSAIPLFSLNNATGNKFKVFGDGTATFASTIQSTTAKLTNLTDGYLPYHISDASGLGNSPIYSDGTNAFINTISSDPHLHLGNTNNGYSGGLTVGYGNAITTKRVQSWIDYYQGVTDIYDSDDILKVRLHARGNSYINGGNVGIGTTAPAYKLEVNGGDVAIIGNNEAHLTIRSLYNNRAATTVYGQISTDIWHSGILYDGTDAVNQNYSIGTSNLLSSAKFTIQNDGNVGIGYTTETPITNNKLAVNGSGYFNGTIKSGYDTGSSVAQLVSVLNYSGEAGISYNGEYRWYTSPNGSLTKDGSYLSLKSFDNGSNAEAEIVKISGIGNIALPFGTINSTGYLLNGNNLFSSLSTNANAKWDGTKFVDGDVAPASGSTNYIQNQNASAQNANAFIAGFYQSSNVGESFRSINSTNSAYSTRFKNNGADAYFGIEDSNGSFFGANPFETVIYTSTPLFINNSIRTPSTIQATTAKLTNLTDGYLPYHISDTSGLGNSPIYTDGTNVGIGITSGFALARLKQNSAASYAGIWIESLSNTNALAIGHTGSYASISSQYSGTGSFTNLMLNENGGNVGIGTTSPWVKLYVNGSIGVPDNESMFFGHTADYNAYYALQYSSTLGGLNLAERGVADGRLFIKNGGNVGIGYSTGDEITNNKLAVNGSGYFATTLTAIASATIGQLGSGSDPYLYFANNASGAPRSISYGASNVDINFNSTAGTPVASISNGGNINSTGYLLNGNNLFSSLSTNANAKWDGTKFVNGDVGGYNTSALYTPSNRVFSVTDQNGTVSDTLTLATTSVAGLMSATDKVKLDEIVSSTMTSGWVGKWDGTKFVNFYNPAVQTLSGTTPTWNVNSGVNASITLTGATTITLSNLVAGTGGYLTVSNGGSTSYNITFAGYTVKVSRSVWKTGDQCYVSGGSKIDLFHWSYNGSILIISGTLDAQ